MSAAVGPSIGVHERSDDRKPSVELSGVAEGGLSPGIGDTLALSCLGLIPIALLPGFFFESNPRQALLIAALPVSLWLLGRMITMRDRAAILAAIFLAVALLGALRSDFRSVSLVGTTSTELSVVALASAFGWWAIGRNLSALAVARLPVVLTSAAGLSVLVGVYQIAVNPSTGLFATYAGRLSGLSSNPVFFASTFVGVWVYWHVRATCSGGARELILTGLLATSVALTGSRGAVVVGLLVAGVTLVARRSRTAIGASAVSLAGVVAGFGILALVAPSQPERLVDANSAAGLRLRIEIWEVALRTWTDRPLLGWGPNPYLHQMNRTIPDRVYRDFPRLSWLDPHNVVLLVLVTTGLVGLALLVTFIVMSLRGSVDVPLLAASGAIVLSWMLQPVVLTTWPIAFALFGAAVRPRAAVVDVGRDATCRPGAVHRAVPAALIAVGLVVGITYSLWSVRLDAAADGGDADRVDAAAGWMVRDPEVAVLVALVHKNAPSDGAGLERHLERAEELAERVVERAGTSDSWALLTEVQVLQGDDAAARATAAAWAAEWPHDPVAHSFVALTARNAGDLDAEERARARVCEITANCAETTSDG